MKNLEEAFQDDIQDEIQDLLSRHFLCSVLKSHSLSDKKPRGFINTIHPPSLVCMPPSFQCLHRCLRLVVKWQIDELSRGQQWEIRWYRGQRDSKFAGWAEETDRASGGPAGHWENEERCHAHEQRHGGERSCRRRTLQSDREGWEEEM